jgi:REP element-mobilizing transposase RayT
VGGIVRELKGTLLDANGAADHVHLVALLRPTMAISDVLQEVKGSSSKWIHGTFAELRDFSWQDGYAAFSVSKSAVPDVLTYVRDQEEHHRRMSFQEELMALLDRHGVEYDPKYILR